MKKGLIITAGVIALLAVMVWADHKFPAAGAPSAGKPSKPTEAPTVALKDLNDKEVTIQDYKGRVVLLNFCAIWFEPCKVDIPFIIEFQQKYGPRGFTLLSVSRDEDGKKAIQPF